MARTTQPERSLLLAALLATGVAALADYTAWTAIPRFLVATLALVGLAWAVTFATEQLGGHLGAGFTGVIGATLANLPELFVIVFALNAGELVVAQTAIVGSMLANALLLLGIVLLVGAARAKDGVMRFGARLSNDTTTLLLVMLFAVVFCSPALGLEQRTGHGRAISILSAACVLAVYVAWLYGYIRRHGRADRERARERPPARRPRLTLAGCLGLLVTAGVGSAFVSEWFIAALRPATLSLHVPLPFAGLVIVAIAGNAIEHAAGVALAARGEADLAISVVKSSVGQIAGFLFPLSVLVSLALRTQLTLALPPVYIGALALMTLFVWQVSDDGEATAFEGVALIALYVIVAVVAAVQ
ncbi:MAG: sodium:proton exchanger [Solirubrobacteraceae bacterium]